MFQRKTRQGKGKERDGVVFSSRNPECSVRK